MPLLESRSAGPMAVTSIEGTPTSGTFFITPLLVGEKQCILSVEALEDTVFLETKSPVPDLGAVLGT